jgi:SNF2 family DNA or RNA helicase
LLRRDAERLAGVDWDVVVLDEAQQIKNPASRGAQAARTLPAGQRLALTGTPMENRLSELWSIVDVTNRGLLGPHERFKETYAVPIERWGDQDAAARLRRMVSPFVMRRTKTDPAIAADLPDKHEIGVTCSLTREQATLYAAAVADAVRDADDGGLAGAEGVDRRGRVLALLTALKQICNHPAQYLGETEPLAARSGKLARTAEMLAEITAAGERALVFTQFRAMGELLARHLGEVLGLAEVPFLHGGTRRTAREALVERFQTDPAAPPVLLVSLRAGGTGLNLTAATHVIHFDRWWNPAVEDQATDRTFRIGQSRTVTAHKLVTAGTVEERIAELLAGKRALADAVVGEGEGWIAELADEDLHDLVALSADAVADDDERGTSASSRDAVGAVPSASSRDAVGAVPSASSRDAVGA